MHAPLVHRTSSPRITYISDLPPSPSQSHHLDVLPPSAVWARLAARCCPRRAGWARLALCRLGPRWQLPASGGARGGASVRRGVGVVATALRAVRRGDRVAEARHEAAAKVPAQPAAEEGGANLGHSRLISSTSTTATPAKEGAGAAPARELLELVEEEPRLRAGRGRVCVEHCWGDLGSALAREGEGGGCRRSMGRGGGEGGESTTKRRGRRGGRRGLRRRSRAETAACGSSKTGVAMRR